MSHSRSSGVKVEVFECVSFPNFTIKIKIKRRGKEQLKILTRTWQGWFGWYSPNQGDTDSNGGDGATWWQIDLGSRYWLDQEAVSDMNDGAARAKDRPCRPQKKNPTFCQLEVTRECGILVPVVFLELLICFVVPDSLCTWKVTLTIYHCSLSLSHLLC